VAVLAWSAVITHTAHEREQDGPTTIAPAAQIVKQRP
jgi:hypothetical protein